MADIETTLKKILAGQAEMQASIDNLTKINAEIKEELTAIKTGKIRSKFKYLNKQKGGAATETWTTRPGETEDNEVDEISIQELLLKLGH